MIGLIRFVKTRGRTRIGYLILLVMLSFVCETGAQPVLNFKRITVDWPRVEMYFSVGCNGLPVYFTDKQHLAVMENGLPVGSFDLWCPDPTTRCPMSVALVFDAGGSMAGSGNAGARAAGNAFVDLMDGTVDEASVIWFSSTVTTAQPMTKYKDLLHTAINGLPASSLGKMWDGVYQGLQSVVLTGTNPCTAVIFLTDGPDAGSTHTQADVISLASRNRIRVFPIGFGQYAPTAALQSVADLTGGRYYPAAEANEFTAIYTELSQLVRQGFQECRIVYNSSCMDGSMRKVDLSVLNFCNGNDTKTKTYKAALDSSTFIPLNIGLGSAATRGLQTVTVPLQLWSPVDPAGVFHPATWTILFDTTRLSFTGITTPPGTLLENVPVTVTHISGGIILQTLEKKVIHATTIPEALAHLTFTAADLTGRDTVQVPLDLTSWMFEAGCFRPVLQDGAVTVVPRSPSVLCDMVLPTALAWSWRDRTYVAHPFLAKQVIVNTGDLEATNTRFTIEIDTADFVLESPRVFTQAGVPPTAGPGLFSEGAWAVSAKPRATSDTLFISMLAEFDNHPPVRCRKKIYVPSALHVRAADTLVNFGDVVVGREQQRSLRIVNDGTAPVSIQSVQVAGFSASSFVVNRDPSGTILSPGTSADVDLAFRPSALGRRSAELRIVTDDEQVLLMRVGLTGNGVQMVPQPRMSLTTDSIDFGPVLLGNTARRSVSVQNTGAATLHFLTQSMTRFDADQFTIAPRFPDSLRMGERANVEFVFTPTRVGRLLTEYTLTVDDTALRNPVIRLAGTGVIQSAPHLTLSTRLLDFGNIRLDTSAERTLVVSNAGTADLTFSVWQVQGPDSADFTLLSGTTSTLIPGGQTVVTLRCAPSQIGGRLAHLTIRSNDPLSPDTSVILSANGYPTALDRTPGWARDITLGEMYPNPVRGVGVIHCTLAHAGTLRITLCDALGRELRLLAHGQFEAGVYAIPVETMSLRNGTYFVRVHTSSGSLARGFVIAR
ncbi:MAG: choice-of-anchor D domain-containing protein [Ignavibacteriae bacterium]|nr:choice-of-anchor D domain-containing protein [Ignavibacteriota bacterium]